MIDFHTKTFRYTMLVAGGLLIGLGITAQQIQYQAELDANQVQILTSHKRTLEAVNRKQNAQVLGTRTVSSEKWLTHEDTESPLTFRYPKNWMVLTENFPQDGQMYRLSIKPQTGGQAFTIFISQQRFFASEGLDGQAIKLGGGSGQNNNDQLITIKKGSYYYTIYAGTDQEYTPEFKAMLETMKF